MANTQTVEKALKGFFAETSALRARFDGFAAKPHTCADRSIFWVGKAALKNGFQSPLCGQKLSFSTGCNTNNRF